MNLKSKNYFFDYKHIFCSFILNKHYQLPTTNYNNINIDI